MITAKLKPRLVITLIINDSVGNIELPEFAEDNYCYQTASDSVSVNSIIDFLQIL